MIRFRLCARLDIKSPHLVKTVNLEGLKVLGDPAEYAERYDQAGIDEIVYLDIVASLYGRNSLHDLIDRTSRKVFTPMTVGGGVRSVEDVRQLLTAGADKVAVNTEAVRRPELITEIAEKFGSQCFVLQIDAKRRSNGWEAWCEGGREPTGKDAIAWAQEAVEKGAGEILVTSIDAEGTQRGADIRLLRALSESIRVPVVGSGGIGRAGHVTEVAQSGCSGVAMASLLHFELQPLSEVRRTLRMAGIPVREPMEEAA